MTAGWKLSSVLETDLPGESLSEGHGGHTTTAKCRGAPGTWTYLPPALHLQPYVLATVTACGRGN